MASFLGRLLSQAAQSLGEGLKEVAGQRTQQLQAQLQADDELLNLQINALGQILTDPSIHPEEAQAIQASLGELIRLKALPPEQRGIIPDYVTPHLPLVAQLKNRVPIGQIIQNPSMLDTIIGTAGSEEEALQIVSTVFGGQASPEVDARLRAIASARYPIARNAYLLSQLGVTKAQLENAQLAIANETAQLNLDFLRDTYEPRVREALAQAGLSEAELEKARKLLDPIVQKALNEAKMSNLDLYRVEQYIEKVLPAELRAEALKQQFEADRVEALIPAAQTLAQEMVKEAILRNQKTEAEIGHTKAETELALSQARLVDAQYQSTLFKDAQERVNAAWSWIDQAIKAFASAAPEEQERALPRLVAQISTYASNTQNALKQEVGMDVPHLSALTDPDIVEGVLRQAIREGRMAEVTNRLKLLDLVRVTLTNAFANTANPDLAAKQYKRALLGMADLLGLSDGEIQAATDAFKTIVGTLKLDVQGKQLGFEKTYAEIGEIIATAEREKAQALKLTVDANLAPEELEQRRKEFDWQKYVDTKRLELGFAELDLRRQELDLRRQEAQAKGASPDILKTVEGLTDTAKKNVDIAQGALESIYRFYGCDTTPNGITGQLLPCPGFDAAMKAFIAGRAGELPPEVQQALAVYTAAVASARMLSETTQGIIGGLTSGGGTQETAPGGGAGGTSPSPQGQTQTTPTRTLLTSVMRKGVKDPRVAGYIAITHPVEGGTANPPGTRSANGPLQTTQSSGFDYTKAYQECKGDAGCIAAKQANFLLNEPSRKQALERSPSPFVASMAHFLPALTGTPITVIASGGKPIGTLAQVRGAYEGNQPLFSTIADFNARSSSGNKGIVVSSDVGAFYMFKAIQNGVAPPSAQSGILQAVGAKNFVLDWDTLRVASAMASAAASKSAPFGVQPGGIEAFRQVLKASGKDRETLASKNRDKLVSFATKVAMKLGYNPRDATTQAKIRSAVAYAASWGLEDVGKWVTNNQGR